MNGRLWTTKDDNTLSALYFAGVSRLEISKKLNRTIGSINKRLSQCNLIGEMKISLFKMENPIGKNDLDTIVNIVSLAFSIKKDSLLHKRRDTAIVIPRQIAHKIAIDKTDFSLAEIGAEIGRKDHTTVLYSEKVIYNLLSVNKKFREDYSKIESYCEETLKGGIDFSKTESINLIRNSIIDIDAKIAFNKLIKKL